MLDAQESSYPHGFASAGARSLLVVERDHLAIRMRGVVKRYGPITAVDGLDLELPFGT